MFEYRLLDLNAISIKISPVDVLNVAGKDGWELVQITVHNMAYLKRYTAPPKPSRQRAQ